MDRFRELSARSREVPSILARRQQRRNLRRFSLIALLLIAATVGAVGGLKGGVGGVVISIGRAFAGLGLVGLAGMMIGVVVTTVVVLIYNGVFSGGLSLLDVDYIDEIPLAFAAISGLIGVFWSLQWSEIVGLLGWGLIALVGNEVIFRRPDGDHR